MTRTAVVLCNLGGPDSLAAVEPFLYNLFSDPDIFRLPLGRLTQRPFARWLAARRRDEAARGYEAIGGASPIGAHTAAQAEALAQSLADLDIPVFVCMRYWHPLTSAVAERLQREQFERVILLPLYPQYSLATTGSAHNEFRRQCARLHYSPDVVFIGSWYQQTDYVEAVARSIEDMLDSFSEPDPQAVTLLLSAHGLPRKAIERGDPYQREIEATAEAVRQRLRWPHVRLCYQSRVGPLEWLRPYTDDVIRAEAEAGVRQMLVYPVAFVSDHVETLFELGITYAQLARQAGIREYQVAPALNVHPLLIKALESLVRNALEDTSCT
ncbi:MAG: ferrochelatase [Gammaproteobacteria bacterium]|nr:ferrochelatase [Gammaproteobacteria bacterium]